MYAIYYLFTEDTQRSPHVIPITLLFWHVT